MHDVPMQPRVWQSNTVALHLLCQLIDPHSPGFRVYTAARVYGDLCISDVHIGARRLLTLGLLHSHMIA